MPVDAVSTDFTFQYSHTIGFMANQGRGFNNPIDLAFAPSGELYVLNRAGPEVGIRLPYKRVTICTADEEYLGEFSTGGTGDGQLWWPSALAFDSEGLLYVADEALNHVSVFTGGGAFLRKWGTGGGRDGELNRPSYIAFDGNNDLIVSDSQNHRVQKFTRDGEFLGSWGRFGAGPGEFNMPWGLALDREGSVYAADWRNDRVQKFDPNGGFAAQWGAPGGGNGQFYRPAALAVDDDGLLYIADWGNERVQVLTPAGEVLAVIRGDSEDSRWAADYFAANPEEGAARLAADLEPAIAPASERDREESANVEKLLWGPTAVKLDGEGRIFIVDSCRHRVQVYRKTPAS